MSTMSLTVGLLIGVVGVIGTLFESYLRPPDILDLFWGLYICGMTIIVTSMPHHALRRERYGSAQRRDPLL